MEKTRKFLLTEKEMPTKWYNMLADMPIASTHYSTPEQSSNPLPG
ncbi:MAG: hypothetical protein R2727_02750 [Bacteroidales bacterium]